MSQVTFSLDGRMVTAEDGETIWQVAKREGVAIPHLCHKDAPGYRSDGNCRACMVDIEGERVLAASCIRTPAEGMVVKTTSERATKAREMVFELLAADQPSRDQHPDPESDFWKWSDRVGVSTSRFAPCAKPAQDISHPAIAVACAPAGKCRSTTSSAWRIGDRTPCRCSIWRTRWGFPLALPAANACRPVRPGP